MRRIELLAKSRLLIRPKGAKCISTFVCLNQEAQLADATAVPPPLPSNPASGSPLYQENWRSPIPPSAAADGALIPAGFGHPQHAYALAGHFLSGAHEDRPLIDQFADMTTTKEWDKIKYSFELWVKMLDEKGKPNQPDVKLYNHYLLASFMIGASAGELLDLVAQMEDYNISPNTASYNLVLKAMLKAGEMVAAEKLLERMILSGSVQKDSVPDADTYDIVIGMLLAKNHLDSALKYIDISLKSGYELKMKTFLLCIHQFSQHSKLDNLVSIIDKCKKTVPNKSLCPPWRVSNYIADVAMQFDNSMLAFHAISFMATIIARGRNSIPPVVHSIDEGLALSALGTAGRTYNSSLLDGTWAVLKHSLKKVPSPELYLGKLCAHANFGNLEKAFNTLRDFENAYKNSNIDTDDDIFSPFFALNPLVLACSRNGFKSLDSVYYQLETLSQDDPPFKSVAALNCVILGCANIWDVDRAYQTFSVIDANFGLTPNIHSYNSLICAFGKLGKLDEAVKVYAHFLGLGVKPNSTTYSLLVEAHLIKRDPKAALSIVDEMVEAGYEPSKEILKKIRRRCIREMNYECNDKVDSLAKQFTIRLGTEARRGMLFNLQYGMDYA